MVVLPASSIAALFVLTWLAGLVLLADWERWRVGDDAAAILATGKVARRRHRDNGRIGEEPLPIKGFRRFEPYHEIPDGRERRKAVVALHYEGWANKSIALYHKIARSIVRRVLNV